MGRAGAGRGVACLPSNAGLFFVKVKDGELHPVDDNRRPGVAVHKLELETELLCRSADSTDVGPVDIDFAESI